MARLALPSGDEDTWENVFLFPVWVSSCKAKARVVLSTAAGPYLAGAAGSGALAVHQGLRQRHPELRLLQVQLHEQVSAALAQHAGRNSGGLGRLALGLPPMGLAPEGQPPVPSARGWGEGPVLNPGITPAPVAPLLDAACQMCRHLPDALSISTAAAEQQRQPGLEEATGCGVPVLAPALRLRQDQVRQANELRGLDPQHELLSPLLQQAPTHQPQDSTGSLHRHPTLRGGCTPRPACGVRWSLPCQTRGTWTQAQRKSKEVEGSNLEGSKEGTLAEHEACLLLGTD